jgi:hypothetical protein
MNEYPAFMKIKRNDSGQWLGLFFLVITGLFVSCSNPPPHPATNAGNSDHRDTMHRKPPGSFSDTITIDFPSAIFYKPDSLQLEKIKAITNTMIFDGMMHDCFYQMKNSRRVLRKYYPRVRIVEVKNARYLLFKKTGDQKECIDLDTKNDPCGIFIFDGYKAPRLVDMTNIGTELGFYFSK